MSAEDAGCSYLWNMTDTEKFRFCVAAMLDWTDRHCRYFMRLMTKRSRLYTEMVTAPAILFGNRDLLLKFDETEHPVACQLGGSDPEDLAKAAAIAAQYGYDEINLNCGCPSERVQKGSFGACLMLEPKLVAECFQAIREASGLETTINHRIVLAFFMFHTLLSCFFTFILFSISRSPFFVYENVSSRKLLSKNK